MTTTKHLLPLILTTLLTHCTASSQTYRTFPQRTSAEAAVIEWGHSAIISALDGAVATFGPQTSQGANFEVETGVVLADPIDGVGKGRYEPQQPDDSNDASQSLSDFDKNYPGKLNNADQVEGNMLIMTDAAGLSGVTMARIAKESGAAALMVVNTDQKSGDYIYSLEPESDEEKAYAERYIDIPVIMVSLQAGNVITTATVSEDADPKDVNRGAGLPERIRLYAGGDRPFFEDAMSSQPLVYLIHNMLTEEECDELIRMAEGKYETVNDDPDNGGVDNYLENSFTSHSQKGGGDAINIERTHLWKGAVAGKTMKDIDERMSQVMGFPIEHYSDFQINKHVVGSSYMPHYDINDANGIMATVTVFLNDVAEDEGGELVFSNPGDGGDPIRIRPKKGLAVVHHNTDENYNFDKSTVHEELLLKVGGGTSSSPVKYVAKKFVYLNPQPTAMRIVLPLIAMPFGGKLPKMFVTLHNALIDKFGYETADVYFQKIVTMIPVFLLVLIASAISNFVSGKMKQSSGEAVTDKKKSVKKSSGGGGALENGRAKAKSGSKKKN